MADSIVALQKTSKKRKQSPLSTNTPLDSPFSGVLTRRKSQKYFFSHNRSGKSRICQSSQHSSTQTTTKGEPQLDVGWAAINGNGKGDGDGDGDVNGNDDDDENHVLIKDLRARRVFSKPPKNQTVGKAVNPSCDSELIDCKVEYNNEFEENLGSSIDDINGFGVNSKGEGVDSGNPNSIVKDLIAVNPDLSMSSKNRDDFWVNLVVEDLDVENPNLLLASEKCDSVIDSVNPNSTVLKKCDDYKVNSMAMDLDAETPNYSVVSEKCDSVINSGNLSSSVLKKCVNSAAGNPESQVLKQCDSGGSVGNPNLSVSDKCDGSRVDLVAVGLKGGGLDQLMASGKCDSVVINPGLANSMDNCDLGVRFGEKVSDDMSPNVSNGFVKGRVGGSCEVVNEENLQSTPPDAVFIIRKSPMKQASLNHDGSSEVKNVPNSINGMTLNKCLRRKVFKVPNSFTYKRLLPYLMDMGKDEPCTMKANPSLKIENNVEEKPFVSLSQENTIDATKLPEKLPDTAAACVPQEVSIDRVGEFSTDANASRPVNCCVDRSLTNLADIETQIPDNSEKGVSQDEHVIHDNLAVPFQSSKTSLEVSTKDASLVEPPCHLSVVSEREFETEESLMSKSQSSDKLATLDSVNPNSIELKKCDDYKVNSLAMDLDVETPNYPVVSEKCDSVVNIGNLSSTVLKKCVNSGVGNLELQVLKKCDSGGSLENPRLSVSDKCDASRIDLLAESSRGGDLDQLMAFGKCDSVMNNQGLGNPMNNCDLGVICGEKVSDDMSPNVSNGFVKVRVGGNCEVVNEETLQSTPPEAVFIIRKSPTKQESLSKDGSSEVKIVSNSINGMTLNKCSRRKVFKVPNSFTYKRLLPYLMDRAKDEPCTMKSTPSVKIENTIEEKPFVSLSQESTIDATKLPEKLLDTTAACVPEEVRPDRVDEFSTDGNASRPVNCCVDRSLTNLADIETQIPDNSEKGGSLDEHVAPDNLAVTFESPKTSLEVSMKDNSLVESPCHLSVVSQREFETEESLISKSQSFDKLATLEHFTGLAKGILKRNPRGCRGICSCLDCSSFRLNADKAFEFSRNQLLEAKEVAQDLMKELSNLKCMLKKSVTGAADVNQVEEAYIRASNVEEMTKSRLRQMHEDLYVHSRSKAMLRPRVNFSINVQEDDHHV